MVQLLIYSFVVIEILFSLTLVFNFQNKITDESAILRQQIITAAYAFEGISFLLMLLVRNPVAQYVFYALGWYGGVVLTCNFIELLAHILDPLDRDPVGKYSISILYYLGIIILFVDTFFNRGNINVPNNRITMNMVHPFQVSLHALYIVVFLVSLIYLFIKYNKNATKKREKYLMRLWLYAFLLSSICKLFDFTLIVFFKQDYPIHLLSGLVLIFLTQKMMIFQREMIRTEEDFKDHLRKDSLNSIFICDDYFRIIFMNRRASVASNVVREKFIGRSIFDLFRVSSTAEESILHGEHQNEIETDGTFAPLNSPVRLNVVNHYDSFEELHYSIITIVSGMEDLDPVNGSNENQTSSSELDTGVDSSVTENAKVLMIFEDAIRAKTFECLLEPYHMNVKRSVRAENSIQLIKNKHYDLIFIDQNMQNITPFELVNTIRSCDDDYYQTAPIIFVANQEGVDQARKESGVSFTDCLTRPVSAKLLSEMLVKYLKPREKELFSNMLVSEFQSKLVLCEKFWTENNYDYFVTEIRAIAAIANRIHHPEFAGMCRAIINIIRLGEYPKAESVLEDLKNQIGAYIRNYNEDVPN